MLFLLKMMTTMIDHRRHHNFLLLKWDVKVHNHLLLDMVMTMVVHDRWNMHNLFLCPRDWHFNYMLEADVC